MPRVCPIRYRQSRHCPASDERVRGTGWTGAGTGAQTPAMEPAIGAVPSQDLPFGLSEWPKQSFANVRCGIATCHLKLAPLRRSLFLQWIRRSIAVGVPPIIGDHIDVRVCATVFRVGCANFEYPGWPARFV